MPIDKQQARHSEVYVVRLIECVKELYDCIIAIDQATGYLNLGYGESEILRNTKQLIKELETDED